jgi:hypothetical protein
MDWWLTRKQFGQVCNELAWVREEKQDNCDGSEWGRWSVLLFVWAHKVQNTISRWWLVKPRFHRPRHSCLHHHLAYKFLVPPHPPSSVEIFRPSFYWARWVSISHYLILPFSHCHPPSFPFLLSFLPKLYIVYWEIFRPSFYWSRSNADIPWF